MVTVRRPRSTWSVNPGLATSGLRATRSIASSPGVFTTIIACYMALNGCAQSGPPVGGDVPVTSARLRGTRLKLVGISSTVTWQFGDQTVVIGNDGHPLPSDLVELLLNDESATCAHIEAEWSLDEKSEVLTLSNMTADGDAVEFTPELRISPAGPIRVNIVDCQYNIFRDPPDDSQH